MLRSFRQSSPPRAVRRPLQLAAFIAALLLPAGLAGAESADDFGRTVELSPYEVTANTVEFERWIKVSSPHFLIYTDARLKEAMRLVRQMEKLHTAVQHFLRRNARVRDRQIFVLPTAGSDWRKIAAMGGVEWRVAISVPARRLRDLVVVQYNWQDDGQGLLWNTTAENTAATLNIPMSFWFSGGLGFFFETAVIDNESIKVGWANARSFAPKANGWLPWPRFFEVNGSSPEFTQKKSVDEYVGQCAVFVQYMLANRDPVWFGRLFAWNALLVADRKPDEALFKEVFQLDYAGIQKTLSTYLETGKYGVWSMRFPLEAEVPVEQQNLKVTEMRELFVLSQILNQHIPASEESLTAVLARGLQSSELQSLLVEACMRWNRRDDALELLRAMTAAGSNNPAVYTSAAGVLLDRLTSSTITIHSRLTLAEAAEIRQWCQHALTIDPLHEIANSILAWTAAIGPEVTETNVREIGAICRVLDGNGDTDEAIAALAVARWRTGKIDSAKVACRTLLESWLCSDDPRGIAAALWKEIDSATPIPTLPSLEPLATEPLQPAAAPEA